MPTATCPRALADARELARRLGAHRHRDEQAAVILVGSKATGSHGPASDTDLMVVPTWRTWPGPHADRAADRTVARFQRGSRTAVHYHPNGTDIGVTESWQTSDFHEVTLETITLRCWSPGTEPKFPEYDEHDPGYVALRRTPDTFPAQNPTTANAVICADTGDILTRALATIPAHTTGPLDPAGTPVRIAASHAMGRMSLGGYGRWDFPHHGPHKEKQPPDRLISEVASVRPQTPWELAQAAAAQAEDAAEEFLFHQTSYPEISSILGLLHIAAASADSAAALIEDLQDAAGSEKDGPDW